jgi:hypothetical protein
MFSIDHNNSRRPRRHTTAALPRLLGIALFLLPLPAIGQQTSSIEVEISPDVWQPCGNVTETGYVPSPLLTPLTPAAGSQVAFRVRKNSIAGRSENLQLDSLQFAPPSSDAFAPRSATEVQFTSVPVLPFPQPNGGTQVFDMALVPPEAGTYRFGFSSSFWDGGSCTVDVVVPEEPP